MYTAYDLPKALSYVRKGKNPFLASVFRKQLSFTFKGSLQLSEIFFVFYVLFFTIVKKNVFPNLDFNKCFFLFLVILYSGFKNASNFQNYFFQFSY